MDKIPLARGFSIISLVIISGLLFLVLHKSNNRMSHIYNGALASVSNGYGCDFGDRTTERHYPMAHSLIASSESNRYRHTHNREALRKATENADWLIKNSDINNNGIIGWGLPYSWDAFQDGSINPAHTEYTITTALAIQGLLDVVDITDDFKKKGFVYLEMAQKATHSFIEGEFYTEKGDGTIAFWYSSQAQDRFFVPNVHAMFSGILQRISTYPIDENNKDLYQDLADKAIQYLLNSKIEVNGTWYWLYCPSYKKPRENDIVHAAYTADGVLMYKRYGGALSGKINEQKILNGLSLFIKNEEILRMFSRPELSPRSWGLGYFLYVICNYYPQEREIKTLFYEYILTRQEEDGFKYTSDKDSPTNYVRHNAHILLGLSEFLWN